MTSSVRRTLLWALPNLLVVTFVVFAMLDLAPGDPAATIAGPDADPTAIAAIHHQLGLDQPLPERYVRWVGGALHGDMQKSLTTKEPVADMVFRSLPATMSLVFVALLFVVLLALLLGAAPLLTPKGWVDRLATVVAGFLLSMPTFWVALLLVGAFAVDRQVFPALGYVKLTDDPWQWFWHLVLPGLALSLTTAGEVARQLRGALRDVLAQDYALAARAKGLSRRRVLLKHGMKNAAAPVVTVLGVRVAALLGGTAIIEQIFLIDGMGRLTIAAVLARDVPVVLGIVMVATAVVLVLNVLIDLSYSYFNPRVRVA